MQATFVPIIEIKQLERQLVQQEQLQLEVLEHLLLLELVRVQLE